MSLQTAILIALCFIILNKIALGKILTGAPFKTRAWIKSEKVAIIGVVVILCIVLVITRCVRRNNGRTIYKDPLQTKIDF